MKNKIMDLNNHLFEELERLNDEELVGDKLVEEIKRADAIEGIATQIINNSKVALEATSLQLQYGSLSNGEVELPAMLENKK